MNPKSRKAFFAQLPDWKLKQIGDNYADIDLTLRDLRNESSTPPYLKKTIGQAVTSLSMAIDGMHEHDQKRIMEIYSQGMIDGGVHSK